MGKYNNFDVQAMLNFMSAKAEKIDLTKLDARKWRLYVFSEEFGEFEMEGTLFYITMNAFKPYLRYAKEQRNEAKKLFDDLREKRQEMNTTAIQDAIKRSQYYLHTNGRIIFKPHGGVDATSDFVVEVWNGSDIGKSPVDFTYFLKEAWKLGADQSEIYRLAEHNDLDSFMSGWRDIIFDDE
ncbi:hypothetical protein KB976_000318 [Vibrio parahaemolyticus]|nr:hypothetical protein [Vibrio parahaemolyticus]